MNTTIPPGLTSIIVPCFNQVEFTRLCLQALFRHTRGPWELIVVDNGSTDETAAYLDGVQDATPCRSPSSRMPRTVGFPAAINQGLQEARGEYLVLLNNDAVVTDGWLDQLIALTRIRPEPQCDRETFGPVEGGVGSPHADAADSALNAGSPAPNANLEHCPLPTLHSKNWPGRADVELCHPAATGRACAVSRPGRDARVRRSLARPSTGANGSPCPSSRASAS